MTVETKLVSFVVRFVCDQPPGDPPGPADDWHGLIRHVQSNEELHFVNWADAVAFIQRYVNVAEDVVHE